MSTALSNLLAKADPKYSDRIDEYQSKIRVLLYNYSLIEKNQLKLSEKEVSTYKQKVERHLIKITRKQRKLTEKLMKTNQNAKKGPETENKRIPASEDETTNESSKSTGKLGPTNMSMKDRMAAVRGMRKKKRRNGASQRTNSSKKHSGDTGGDNGWKSVLEEDAALILKPGQYKGDITEEEMTSMTHKRLDDHDIKMPNPTNKFSAPETTLTSSDLTKFMLNIGLLTTDAKEKACEQQEVERTQKEHWRNLTYIPEVTDGKKHRVKYTYLNPEVGSPPMLRARHCQNRAAFLQA